MDGLLLVNKPSGITSFDVIRRLRQITGVKKIGHAGTLDPMATGLMLLLIGSATKAAGVYSKLDKTYQAEINLGSKSSTGDAEGELTKVSNRQPKRAEVETALGEFQGLIQQVPPIYSAIKIKGQEAFKRARRGEVIEMPSRLVTINSIKLDNYHYPLLKITADVSSGTYIRSLAEAIGENLETGAYLSGLVRTRVGKYRLEQAVSLDASANDIASAILKI
jgi:tRNA pseudouridine55 synthase